MKEKGIVVIFFLLFTASKLLYAQGLNCEVQVNSDQVTGTDQRVFDAMQETISEFLNTNAWTSQKYLPHEKIECDILIRLTSIPSANSFTADFHIAARRPVFNSIYYSTLFNHIDKGVAFNFSEFDRLYFNPQTHLSNLTSVLAFYAYIIIALDYDSFEKMGGTPYFLKAQKIVSNAQNEPTAGWNASENNRNRFWNVTNFLSPDFTDYRNAFYTYHREGLDNMWNKLPEARKKIMESLQLLEKQNQIAPLSLQSTFFFNAKSDELIDIFSKAFTPEKNSAKRILQKLNPTNASKYDDKIN